MLLAALSSSSIFLCPDEEMEGGKKKGEKKSSKKEKEKETQPSLKKTHSFSSADDINKMRVSGETKRQQVM